MKEMVFFPLLEGVYTWHFIPGWNPFWAEIISVYGEVSLTVYTFSLEWSFIPGWTNSFQNGKDEISSQDDKKEKKTCEHFILEWYFTRYHKQNYIIILPWYIIRFKNSYYYKLLISTLWYLMKAEFLVRITSLGSIMVLYFWKKTFLRKFTRISWRSSNNIDKDVDKVDI